MGAAAGGVDFRAVRGTASPRLAAEVSVPGVAAIEANISCPNIEEDGKAFAMRAASTEAVVRQLRSRHHACRCG